MREFIAIALCILLPSTAFTQTSAIKNSFQEVTSKLDPGGNLYLYLSTEEWLKGVSTQISQLRDVVNAVPTTSADDKQNSARFFELLSKLLKQSGVEDISGFGISSIAVEKELYRSKTVLHHYRGNQAGYLWSGFGKQPHALDALDFLPSTTAFAASSDWDPALLWSILANEISQSGIPDARQSIQNLRAQFAAMTGLTLDRALESLGGECILAFTIDETRTMPFVPGMQLPDLGLMLVLKVKNDTIFDMVDSTLRNDPTVVRTDRKDLRMRTMPTPPPMTASLRPSIARSGDYLLVASTDTLIETALAVKARTKDGLKSTNEFMKLSRGVLDQGNSFTFRSQKIAEVAARLQSQILAANTAGNNPAQAQILTNLFGSPGTMGSYRVAANTDEGWLAVGNSGQNPATTFFLLPGVAAVLIIATVAIPSLLRSRQAANESAAVANLRTIATAQVTYAASSRGNYGSMPALVSAGLLDSRFTSTVAGYQFTITVSGRNYLAEATPESANSGRYAYFVTTDSVVRYSDLPALAPTGQNGEPVQ